jgi:hypothetical protein
MSFRQLTGPDGKPFRELERFDPRPNVVESFDARAMQDVVETPSAARRCDGGTSLRVESDS